MSDPTPTGLIRRFLPAVAIASPSLARVREGHVVAWTESGGRLHLAFEARHYRIVSINPDWQTFDTPAIAWSPAGDRLFLAWRAAFDAILIGHDANGWTLPTIVAGQGATDAAPALACIGDRLFVAWTDRRGDVLVETCDLDGRPSGRRVRIPAVADADDVLVARDACDARGTRDARDAREEHDAEATSRASRQVSVSRPALTVHGDTLYVLTGVAPDLVDSGDEPELDRPGSMLCGGDAAMRVYVSRDHGETFVAMPACPIVPIGPPSFAIADDGEHHLAWAAGSPERPLLHVARGPALRRGLPRSLRQGCHEGPSMIVDDDALLIAVRYGAPAGDELAGRVALVRVPL